MTSKAFKYFPERHPFIFNLGNTFLVYLGIIFFTEGVVEFLGWKSPLNFFHVCITGLIIALSYAFRKNYNRGHPYP